MCTYVCLCVHVYIFFLALSTEWAKKQKFHGSWGFPGGAVVGGPPANAGDVGSGPGLGRSHMPQSNWASAP